MVYIDGKPIKVKPEKKRPGNRKRKRVYTDEVTGALRLVWTFFWFRYGREPEDFRITVYAETGR
jgi:hypothetical protein